MTISDRARKHIVVGAVTAFYWADTAATVVYTLSLHDALPISSSAMDRPSARARCSTSSAVRIPSPVVEYSRKITRSEEHTSELQSQFHLVCRLLLAKKKPRLLPRRRSTPCALFARARQLRPSP